MTAGKTKPTVRRERRIIERPRLIKLLDESEARIILLLAPAGYGKTTLARQWAKTLSGAIWVTLTPAHRDVVTFAEDIAAGVEALGGNSSRFIREYLLAQSNPQRAAVDVARTLSQQMNDAGVQWLVLDDYHAVSKEDEIATMMQVLEERLSARTLVASRDRPSWLKTRRVIYGEVTELSRSDLAMTSAEAKEMLGQREATAEIATQARGWPAALSLAASVDVAAPPIGTMRAGLHQYLADELFNSVALPLQDDLLTLALLPDLKSSSLAPVFGMRSARLMADVRDTGFIGGDDEADLHPLLREFLLLKIARERDAESRVRDAINASLAAEAWDNALDLVLRFELHDLIDAVTEAAFSPLIRGGRIGTLSAFAMSARAVREFPAATVDLIEAEVALRDGRLELAMELATRADERLPDGHRLRSHANTIVGHTNLLLACYDEAEAAFVVARETATDARDESEAVHGLGLTRTFGERSGAEEVIAWLAHRRHESPTDLVRFTTDELNYRRFQGNINGSLGVDEALHTLSKVDDPRARTSLTYSLAYTLGLRADYREALRYLDLLLDDIRRFNLEFALPYANWTVAFVSLGLRRFGVAERALQAVEDVAQRGHGQGHAINARALRARLLLQLGHADDALRQVGGEVTERLIPSWHAEYIATRALALACLDRADEAREAGALAKAMSQVAEVRLLAASADAVVAAQRGDGETIRSLVRKSSEIGAWDPFICAVRSSRTLAVEVSKIDEERVLLEEIYRKSNDRGLARAAGFRTRETRSPDQVLTPRELEVLGLIARGLRNREISEALFIADSTTKVHVRHILEKLGVRTRAQAVARYEMFTDAK